MAAFKLGRYYKFRNRPTRCSEGIMHQGKAEAEYCTDLHVLQRAGRIVDLKAHPQERFRLDVKCSGDSGEAVHICDYLADFVYTDVETGELVVEDVKGWQTAESKIKIRLMLAVHGIEVRLVRAGGGLRGRMWR